MKSEFNESVQIHDPMMNCELKTLTAPPLPSPKENEQIQKGKKSMWMGSLSCPYKWVAKLML